MAASFFRFMTPTKRQQTRQISIPFQEQDLAWRIEYGQKYDLKPFEGVTCKHALLRRLILEKGVGAEVNLLLKHGAQFEHKDLLLEKLFLERGVSPEVNFLLTHGARFEHSSPLLSGAILKCGLGPEVDFLLTHGAWFENKDSLLQQVLSKRGLGPEVHFLLTHGAQFEHKDLLLETLFLEKGVSPEVDLLLMHDARFRRKDHLLKKMLLKKGVSPEVALLLSHDAKFSIGDSTHYLLDELLRRRGLGVDVKFLIAHYDDESLVQLIKWCDNFHEQRTQLVLELDPRLYKLVAAQDKLIRIIGEGDTKFSISRLFLIARSTVFERRLAASFSFNNLQCDRELEIDMRNTCGDAVEFLTRVITYPRSAFQGVELFKTESEKVIRDVYELAQTYDIELLLDCFDADDADSI